MILLHDAVRHACCRVGYGYGWLQAGRSGGCDSCIREGTAVASYLEPCILNLKNIFRRAGFGSGSRCGLGFGECISNDLNTLPVRIEL